MRRTVEYPRVPRCVERRAAMSMTAVHIIGLVADVIIIGTAIGLGIVKLREISRNFTKAMREGMRG